MNYKLLKRIGINEPADGYTAEEEKIAELLGEHTVQSLYAKLPTSKMKFIVAAHFELGYPQDLVAEMLSISQPTLSDHIGIIQKVLLGGEYKAFKSRKKSTKTPSGTVRTEDLLKFLMVMSDEGLKV